MPDCFNSFNPNISHAFDSLPDDVIGHILAFLLEPCQLWLPQDVPNSSSTVTVSALAPPGFKLQSKRFYNICRKTILQEGGTLREIPRNRLIPTACSDVRGGGTRREFISNILKNGPRNWNKWFSVASLPVRVGFELRSGDPTTKVYAYAVRFANDVSARDPIAWTVTDEVPCRNGQAPITWTINDEDEGPSLRPIRMLHQVCLRNVLTGQQENIARYEWRVFRLPEPCTLTHGFSLVITEVRKPGHGVQLCQISLLTK